MDQKCTTVLAVTVCVPDVPLAATVADDPVAVPVRKACTCPPEFVKPPEVIKPDVVEKLTGMPVTGWPPAS
jgi:hypothetical protein